MSVRIKYDVDPEIVKPKLEDLVIKNITAKDMVPDPTTAVVAAIQSPFNTTSPSPQDTANKGYAWDSWSLSLSLSNMQYAANAITTFLKQVDKLTKVVAQLLKVMQLFSGNVKSIAIFLQFITKALAKALKDLINSFASSGVYLSIIAPNFDRKAPKYTIPVYGGYREFISRVNATCTSSSDPDAPKFDNPKDKVGGVILAMLGGTNDPEFLSNLVHNFKVLSEFFGFQNPMPSPAKNFKATAGLFRKPGTSDKVFGVQLTWDAPDNPVTRYGIYRSTVPTGIPKNPSPVIDGVEVNVMVLGEMIADAHSIPGKAHYRYTDFDVKDGVTYYYKIYSMIGDTFFEDNPLIEDLRSPIATSMQSVTPKNCIPVSELAKYTTLGINGEFLNFIDLKSEWQSLTIRRLLGKSIDIVLHKIDDLADRIAGMVNTGSSATTEFIDFYAKKVSDILALVTEFSDIITRLMAFNMRGTFMVLKLPVQEGGMAGFVDRFNKASSLGDTASGVQQSEQPNYTVAKITKNGGIGQYTEKGIMFGVILLFGYPDLSADRLVEVVPPGEVEALKAKIKVTEKAVATFVKLLGLE